MDNHFHTSVEGIFSAGNVVHVYDLVDWVTEAGLAAGKAAARFAMGLMESNRSYIKMKAGVNVRSATVLRALIHLTTPSEMIALAVSLA